MRGFGVADCCWDLSPSNKYPPLTRAKTTSQHKPKQDESRLRKAQSQPPPRSASKSLATWQTLARPLNPTHASQASLSKVTTVVAQDRLFASLRPALESVSSRE